MQHLHIEPVIPFVLAPVDRVALALVGCGGTGSHLAQTIAKLAAHCQQSGGPELEIFFIDGDRVEEKNIGRQLFGPQDLYRNKAEVLAARFNAVWGLRITAIPHMLDDQTLAGLHRSPRGILVGAVDSAAARALLNRWSSIDPWQIWLDCGNHEYSGQVVCGTTNDAQRLDRALSLGSVCTDVPSPALVYPDLLKQPPKRPRLDCAAAMEDNRQSLLVNQLMATIAGQYLNALILNRQLTRFETVADLDGLTMRSTPITARTLAPYMTKKQKEAAA